MIKNYFQTALRNMLRNKNISLINIIGLSLSMSVCMLIIVVIQDQYQFDNFVDRGKEIYRIQTIDNLSKVQLNRYASTTFPLARDLRDNYSFIEDAVAISNSFGGKADYNGKKIPVSGFYCEDNFFRIFNFSLTRGSVDGALAEPFSIVLNDVTAKKYFGEEDPYGKTLVIENLGNFKVTGIVSVGRDKSHIKFEALVSASTMDIIESNGGRKSLISNWTDFDRSYVYIIPRNNVSRELIEETCNQIGKEKYAGNEKIDVNFYLVPFNKIVPGPLIGNTLDGGNLPLPFLLFFAGLGLVIITSATFNYTSLSIARSLTRAREFGIRKTVGASRRQLTIQIFIEAIVVSMISLGLSIIILQALIPAFQSMKLMSLLELDLNQNVTVFFWFLVFAIFTGLLAGSLPALYISRINPVTVLKGASNIKIIKGLTFRKILLVMQYFFSIVFIITIILVYRQLNFMINAEMGFDRELVYNLRTGRQDYSLIADRFGRVPEVISVAAASHIPGIGNIRDTEVKLDEELTAINSHYFSVSPGYLDVMGLNLIAGTDFPSDLSGQQEKFVIISRMASEKYNFKSPVDAIGSNLIVDDTLNLTVIGVVDNYRYVALFLPERPLLLRNIPLRYNYSVIRFQSQDLPATLEHFREVWKEIDPANEMSGEFLDAEIRDFYGTFKDVLYTVGYATILAVLIACLGLLGMATYSIQTRRREVGIRKVYGAESGSIILLVSGSTLRPLLVASLLAVPVAYILNNAWLSFISTRVSFGAGSLISGMMIVMVVGFITIAGQTLKVSNTNPARILKHE